MKLKQFLKRTPVPPGLSISLIQTFCGWENFVKAVPQIGVSLEDAHKFLEGRANPGQNWGMLDIHPDGALSLVRMNLGSLLRELLQKESKEIGMTIIDLTRLIIRKTSGTVLTDDDLALHVFGSPYSTNEFRSLIHRGLASYALYRLVYSYRQLADKGEGGGYLGPSDGGFFEDIDSPNTPEADDNVAGESTPPAEIVRYFFGEDSPESSPYSLDSELNSFSDSPDTL